MLESSTGLAVIRSLPADRLLTEADAPFTEVDNRKSEPSDVTRTVARLAQIRNSPVDEMKRTVSANAERVLAFAGVRIPT
jgi:TatD DNase family protein